MEFYQQNVHQKQVKTLVTMEGRFDHNSSMTRDRPEAVVPQSLTFQELELTGDRANWS